MWALFRLGLLLKPSDKYCCSASVSQAPRRPGFADVTVDASRGPWAPVFSPSAAEAPLPVVVYLHGGGFVLFSPASRPYDALCREFGTVVSVNYRLAPEHRFPAAYDDGVAALRYLDVNGLPGAPVDLSSCFLAGGNITSSPAVSLRLAGAVLIQPFFGGEERTEAEVALDKVAPRWRSLAGEVRGDAVREGEAGAGGRVPRRHSRLPRVPGSSWRRWSGLPRIIGLLNLWLTLLSSSNTRYCFLLNFCENSCMKQSRIFTMH